MTEKAKSALIKKISKLALYHFRPQFQGVVQLLNKSALTTSEYQFLKNILEESYQHLICLWRDAKMHHFQVLGQKLRAQSHYVTIYPQGKRFHAATDVPLKAFNDLPPTQFSFLIWFTFFELKIDTYNLEISDTALKNLLNIQCNSKNEIIIKIIQNILDLYKFNELNVRMREPINTECHYSTDQRVSEFANFFIPQNPKHISLIQEKNPEFTLFNDWNANNVFSSLSEDFGNEKESLTKGYQLIYDKLINRQQAAVSLFSDRAYEIFPSPRHAPDAFNDKLEDLIEPKVTLDLSQRIKRLLEEIRQEEEEASSLDEPEFNQQESSYIANSPFEGIDDRVLRWFDDGRDPLSEDYKYRDLKDDKKAEVIFKHKFAWICNDIAHQFAFSSERPNRNGINEKMFTMAVQAKNHLFENPRDYVLTLTANSAGIIYHRTLSRMSQGEVVDQLTQRGFRERQSSGLDEFSAPLDIPDALRRKVAADGSYIKKFKGRVIKVIDPKYKQKSGKDAVLYLMVV